DVELHPVAGIMQDALERLCRAYGQGRLLDHDLVVGGHGGNLPCAELDVFQVGRHTFPLAVGLGGGIDRDENHIGCGDGCIHIGGEEQVAATGLGHHGVQPRLVDRQLGEVLIVPCR